MKGLTDRQRETLEYIKAFIAENKFSPTFQEIADYINCSHPAVREITQSLISKGYIERLQGKPRTIRVL
jgi:repressor LexA